VRAAKSDTLASLYTAMASILMRSHRDRRALVVMDVGIKEYLIADHRRIFEAVVAHDEAAADRLLRDHFNIGDNYRHKAAVEPRKKTTPVTKRAVLAAQKRGSS